eukprot:4178933-Alexandrium_andersonii.AAC.1
MPSSRRSVARAPAQPARRRVRQTRLAPRARAAAGAAAGEPARLRLPPALAAMPLLNRSEPFLPVEECVRFTPTI